MMTLGRAIFKIGGSILENPESLKNTISQLSRLVQERLIKQVIIIPGGGLYANFIRELDKKLGIGSTMAHWMAIYAMDYNGNIIGQQYPSIKLIENFEVLMKNEDDICLFLPFKHLKLLDPLPHSWDITSDAISLYVTNELQLKQTFLIKDVDGIIDQNNKVLKSLTSSNYSKLKKSGKLARIESNGNQIKHSKPLDNYCIKIIEKYRISCVLLNGAINDSRIYLFFASNNELNKTYTEITFP